MPQAGSLRQGANQIDWQRQSKKTFQQNLIHCPRYDHELRASNHALVSRTPVCARGGGEELVTRLQARRAAQSILNGRNKGNKSIHTIKAGVEGAQCLSLQTEVRK